ncbi:hypothetical protein PGTUg99_019934 [Puccinia graminis f. sp. tritici]|uniref:Uncharacterized protein n=1 Tax=Puccinia graminis f. sp. tritici TaxID=56615 RepID=A0A5B0SLR7_PUCGR|nr:hypothetical protein PGTUg99_026624 [Puccinia graminis f. sp. tritici]KAA1138495.1 hypothetical protein PGTUg99_019934 [Puccinia graminis f. sp. tritici]
MDRGLVPLLSERAAKSLTVDHQDAKLRGPATTIKLGHCTPPQCRLPSAKISDQGRKNPTVDSHSPDAKPAPSSPRPLPPLIDSQPDPASNSLIVLRPDLLPGLPAPVFSNRLDRTSVVLANTPTVLCPTLTARQSDSSSSLLVDSRQDSSTVPPPPPLPQPKTASQPAARPDPPTVFPPPSPYLTISAMRPASPSTSSDMHPQSLAAKTSETDTAGLVHHPEAFSSELPPSSLAISLEQPTSLEDRCPPAVTSSPIDTGHLPGITTVVEPNDLSLPSSAASASLATTAVTTTTPETFDDHSTNTSDHHPMSPTLNQTMANTLPSTLSSADRNPANHLSNFAPNSNSLATPPEIATSPLTLPEFLELSSAPSPKTNFNSCPIHPTATACSANLEIAAVGSLTVMDENSLAALERQSDPRYRPIEDSEFVPFEDW